MSKYLPVPKTLLLISCLFSLLFASAQTNTVVLLKQYQPISKELSAYLTGGQIARFDRAKAAALIAAKLPALELSFQFENQDVVLELNTSTILSKGFSVMTGSNPHQQFPYDAGNVLHYKGKIKGKPHSFAAVSIMADRLVAVIADEKGNINIGAINTPSALANNEHIIYRESSLLIKNQFECGTEETKISAQSPVPDYTIDNITANVNNEPVDIYFEADNSTYVNNGSSISNTVNYVTALFNVVHLLYENDSINSGISSIKVWDVQDPYVASSTTATALTAFSNNMVNGFPGDVAHLLSQRALGGGRAFLDILCSSDAFKTGVSGNLSNSFNQFPTYSWSAMVITHEVGHNLGSPHTQSCSWPGGAIDNCYTTEGGCAPGPAPVNGGTMMSYCHLVGGVGINFANGFGPLPGALIRSRLRNNICINPTISFQNGSQTTDEDSANVENGCSDYRLLTIRMSIPYAPSKPADINLLATGSSNLVIGTNKDVEVSPLSFRLDSANLSQLINIKVYNDAVIESTETLTINFSLNANSGNAIKKNYNTTFNLNITDGDHRPDSTPGKILYYEPFDTITTGTGNWQQTVLYGAASPNRWVIANSGDSLFPSKAAYISNNGSAYAYSGTVTDDSVVVRLISPVINGSGFSNMHLSYAYKCMGELVYNQGGGTGQGESATGRDFGRVLYSINNGSTWFLLKDNIAGREIKQLEDILLPAAAATNNFRIAFEWHNNTSVVNNPPLLIDSIVIKGASTCDIQSAAHAANTAEAYLGPFETVHFYNPVTKNIMASIQNLSSFDFGCTSVQLLRTGTGAAAAWDSTAGSKISDKVFKIIPQNNNDAAPYKLTLYYTSDEINGWKAATGNNNAAINIVKTGGDLLSYPVTAPASFSSIVSNGIFGATVHSAISAEFTGFAAFAIGRIFSKGVCPAGNLQYGAGISGTSYQWQVNTGNGYTNIANGINVAGSTADTLRLITPPAGWYGYRFRCRINSAFGTVYSPEQLLKFEMGWLGTQSKAWEDPLNWGCANLPDANTDVLINAGTPFSPEINSNVSVRSLKVLPHANITVKIGKALLIKN